MVIIIIQTFFIVSAFGLTIADAVYYRFVPRRVTFDSGIMITRESDSETRDTTTEAHDPFGTFLSQFLPVYLTRAILSLMLAIDIITTSVVIGKLFVIRRQSKKHLKASISLLGYIFGAVSLLSTVLVGVDIFVESTLASSWVSSR